MNIDQLTLFQVYIHSAFNLFLDYKFHHELFEIISIWLEINVERIKLLNHSSNLFEDNQFEMNEISIWIPIRIISIFKTINNNAIKDDFMFYITDWHNNFLTYYKILKNSKTKLLSSERCKDTKLSLNIELVENIFDALKINLDTVNTFKTIKNIVNQLRK